MKRKSFFIILLCSIFLLSHNIYADDELEEIDLQEMSEVLEVSSQTSDILDINSRAAVIYDRTSGKVIWGKNENDKRKMASTTKIMTAIIVLENVKMDETVTVSQKAAGTGGSRLGLKTGDKISVNDLLYGLLLVSGNDAAVCLAEYVGGSVEGFADKMNEKAEELNLKNTHFVTPHGLDQEEHFTTALELAKLANYALQNKTFSNIVATRNYTVNINRIPKQLNNTNELLGNLYGVNGVKTGFTNGANRCLVTSVKRDEMNIITVVLGADTKKFRTQDSVKLIEYAYKNYKIFNIRQYIEQKYKEWKDINESRINVSRAKRVNVKVKLESIDDEYIPIKIDEEKDINVEFKCEMELEGEVKENQKIGEANIYIKDSKIMKVDILNAEYIGKMEYLDYLKHILYKYTYYLEMKSL